MEHLSLVARSDVLHCSPGVEGSTPNISFFHFLFLPQKPNPVGGVITGLLSTRSRTTRGYQLVAETPQVLFHIDVRSEPAAPPGAISSGTKRQ